MIKQPLWTFMAASLLLVGCKQLGTAPRSSSTAGASSFGEDVAFLKQHVNVHVLRSKTSDAAIAIIPEWQGRVMTSSARGDRGASYGWINYDLIKKGIQPEDQRNGLEKHIYVFGGEERLWLGPEGGQYALFFSPAVKDYTFEQWKTPALLDTEAFQVKSETPGQIVFEKSATLTNHAGTRLDLRLRREVLMLNREEAAPALGMEIPNGVRFVAYESSNTLVNTGTTPWTQEAGLVSLWMLGMYKHGPGVTIVIPLAKGEEPAVNSDYFGPVERDRLRVVNNTVFFKGDGQYRSKIGIPPSRAKGICGSYDAVRGVLTVLRYNQQAAGQLYVRSQWKNHERPYAGDVINAYNDGPPEPGAKPLGPFYELESSSPAAPLQPEQSITHLQTTVHMEGKPEQLDPISRAVLGVSLAEITEAFR
jgi:hypothetical protein